MVIAREEKFHYVVGQTLIPHYSPVYNGQDLYDNSDKFNFYFNLLDPTGNLVVDSGTALYVQTEDGDFRYVYEWQTGDLWTLGVYTGQFRAERKSDGSRIYHDRTRIIVRDRI